MLLSFILKKNITLLNFKLALSSLKQVQYQTIQPWVLTNFFTTALPKFRLWCREETTIIIVFLLLFSHKSCLNVGNSGTAALQGSLSFTISQSLLRFMYPESVMLSKHLIRCCQLLWLLSNFPSIGSFPVSCLYTSGGPKYWSFSFSISPSNEYSGPISFRMEWLNLLAVQGTLKSLLQHHSSEASILECSTLFIVQLSHSYTITGKTTALTWQTFVGKVMSLLFNMLSRLVITFLPMSKCLIFMVAVNICSDFGAQKYKVSHCFHCFPIYLPWSDGTRCHDLSFFPLFHFHQEAL